MPVVKEREYRHISVPLKVRALENKEDDFVVCGYATTFNDPYLMYEMEDGTQYFEEIDKDALKDADVSDVILQYNHEGRVYARTSNDTLVITPDINGLAIVADLSKTESARTLYEEIKAGMITKMSWAFTVNEESFDKKSRTRKITKIKKVYDVSAVSFPANEDTQITARDFAHRSYEAEKRESLNKRVKALKLLAEL